MPSANTNDLRENLANISRTVPEPTWDLIVYCRFLARRLPTSPTIDAAELGRLAEELIVDLKEGVDRATGQTFVPPLVSGRSDLLYDFIRAKLTVLGQKIGGADFSTALAQVIPPTSTPATATTGPGPPTTGASATASPQADVPSVPGESTPPPLKEAKPSAPETSPAPG